MRRRFSIDNKNVNYMAIEALEDGLTATISGGLSSDSKIEYSIDGIDWVNMEIDVATSPINCGEKLLFKGNYLGSVSQYIKFSISKKCNIKGDIKTLWYGDNARHYKTALNSRYLFENCTTIQEVEDNFLSATDLITRCYWGMFSGCTALTTAPKLPATTLADYCYDSMFSGCTSLITAPALPATTLADDCYGGMFMKCTNLTTAPELPATTLANNCYSYMFYGCTKLNYIKMLATNISASSCLANWVNGVASSGTFVKNPAMNSLTTGTSGIPSGWTVVNDGEESEVMTGITIVLIPNTMNDDNKMVYEYMEQNQYVSEFTGQLAWDAKENDNILINGTVDSIVLNNARVLYGDKVSGDWEITWEGKNDMYDYGYITSEGNLVIETDK